MSIKTSIALILLVVLNTFNATAQKDRVLFTLDGNNVYNSEFSKIYEKNLSIVQDESQKDIDNYLDLYVNYRLKLQQAYELKMDTIPSYIKEYTKYKNQLIEPFMNDDNKEKDLIKEGYQRMKKEVNANHILVRVTKEANPIDTLKAYNKVLAARKQILAGKTFEEVARKVSEDPSAKTNGGNLGYFTVFQMVYPFETVAYNTPVGEISMPFKTKFGYHIIKVNDVREAQGEVQVAHIMLKGDTKENIEKINSIKTQLDEGGDFAALAKSYSTDLATSMKGGVLPKFTSNKMVKEFSDAAFSLNEIGAISEPFKTRYGWHIVKLIEKFPVGSFDAMKEEIEKKVKRGQRAKIIGRSVIDRLLKEYKITTDEAVLKLFANPVWRDSKNTTELNKTLLTIEGKEIKAEDFLTSMGNKFDNKRKLKDVYKEFKEAEVLNYYKEELPKNNPELDQTLREYREGLLLFDLMKVKIWDEAEKDSLGLVNFFNNNRAKYQWNERADVTIVTCDKKENAKKAKKYLKKNIETSKIKEKLSKDGIVDIKEGTFEKTKAVFPKGFVFNKGVSDILTIDKQFVVIHVKELLPAQEKELKDTRGRVISDFQDYIEKQWISTLKSQYPVEINQKSLKKLKKKYK
ncbi:MAG TPA: peptidylprolyl isomerase [Lutibacter sp.]|nr:peptidylprolyl isomerase [Lutibacter sp.]